MSIIIIIQKCLSTCIFYFSGCLLWEMFLNRL